MEQLSSAFPSRTSETLYLRDNNSPKKHRSPSCLHGSTSPASSGGITKLLPFGDWLISSTSPRPVRAGAHVRTPSREAGHAPPPGRTALCYPLAGSTARDEDGREEGVLYERRKDQASEIRESRQRMEGERRKEGRPAMTAGPGLHTATRGRGGEGGGGSRAPQRHWRLHAPTSSARPPRRSPLA